MEANNFAMQVLSKPYNLPQTWSKSENQNYDFYYANEDSQFECLINLFYFEKPIKFSILFWKANKVLNFILKSQLSSQFYFEKPIKF